MYTRKSVLLEDYELYLISEALNYYVNDPELSENEKNSAIELLECFKKRIKI